MINEFYSTAPQTEQYKIKEKYTDSDPTAALCNMVRESIRNAIGFNATSILLGIIVDPKTNNRYLVIFHNGKMFSSEEEMKIALQPSKSSRQGGSYFGNGGKKSALLGDVGMSQKEVVFFGKTSEGHKEFAGISQKIDTKNDRYVQKPVGQKWYDAVKPLFDSMPSKESATNNYLYWDDLTVGYAYRVSGKQTIVDRTMFKIMTMMDIPKDLQVAYIRSPFEMGDNIKKGKSYIDLDVDLLEKYSFKKKPSIPFDQFPFTYKQSSDRKLTYGLIGDVKLEIFPKIVAKKKVGDEKRYYPIPTDGKMRTGLHTDPFGGSFFKVLVRQNYKYNENISRMVSDPIYFSKKTNRKLISDMGLPVTYDKIHDALEIDDKTFEFLKQEYFDDNIEIDEIFDINTMRMSPEVVMTFNFDITNKDLTEGQQKDLFHKLTTGLDEFFCVENEDKLKDVLGEICEFIYEKHSGTEGWMEYKAIMDRLLPKVDNSAYQIPEFDIDKKAKRRNGRDCYFTITARGLKDLNDFIEDNGIEWEENKSANKGRPYVAGDRIHKLPAGCEIETNLVDGKTGMLITGASIEADNNKSNKDVNVTNINRDEKYKIQIRSFYHVDQEGNETPIDALQYNEDRNNSYPKSLRGWLVDGKDASIGLNILLPELPKANKGKPHNPGNGKPQENRASPDDIYTQCSPKLYAIYENNRLKYNTVNPTIDMICRDNSNYLSNVKNTFNSLMIDIDAKAREIKSKESDCSYFIFAGTDGDKKNELTNLYQNNFKNWFINQYIGILVECDPRVEFLIKKFHEHNDVSSNMDDSETTENEVVIKEEEKI